MASVSLSNADTEVETKKHPMVLRRGKSRQIVPNRPRYSGDVKAVLETPDQTQTVPDPRPWVSPIRPTRPILMVPAADYHLEELVPLALELERRGHDTVFAIGQSPWERTRRGMPNYPELDMHWLPTPESAARDVSMVVTMKDTGSMTNWVPAVRRLGIPVIGKVEGAQDFWDADTPEQRRPYRNFDLVLCQGQFDADALTDVDTAIVGSTRLERFWTAPPVEPPDEPLGLVNLNFVYGVKTADRKLWLESAIEGCEKAGLEYLISVHPAERTPVSGPRMTRTSAMKLLPYASVLISRFSTVPLEGLAMGIPFVYHNPQGETVPTFADPAGAFVVSRGSDELAAALSSCARVRDTQREGSRGFFERQVDIDGASSSEQRAAHIIEAYLPT